MPIYAHRYLPSLPCAPGNPVLSVWQTDIIYYGRDLAEYVTNEFQKRLSLTEPITPPPFWSYFIDTD